ncbi:MAG: hypothetical protein FJY67_11570 [Calditrichaeota bacterium]|nr:hypothetical protein [Calditrichota bacterium]
MFLSIINRHPALRLVVAAIFVIGLFVWPAPEEARASTTLSVSVFDTDQGQPVTGLVVIITLYLNGVPQDDGQAEEDPDGLYTFESQLGQSQFDNWSAEVTGNPAFITDYISDPNPAARTSSTTNFNWEVQDTRVP